MFKEKISATDLEVLQLLLYDNTLNISQIASKLAISLSWASECVSHLASMGLLEVKKTGISRFVSFSSNPLAKKLSLLMAESPHLNLNKILTGSGMLILPLLLEPGYPPQEIARRVSRSLRTVKDALARWTSMGVAILDKKTGIYYLNPRQKYLIQFVKAYAESRNTALLKDTYPEALIVWQWRDEFLVSSPRHIDHPKFRTAATSRLVEFGYDIIHTSHYYFYTPQLLTVSKAEAFVQSIKVNPDNPRIFRLLTNALDEHTITKKDIRYYAKKYQVKAIINQKVLYVK